MLSAEPGTILEGAWAVVWPPTTSLGCRSRAVTLTLWADRTPFAGAILFGRGLLFYGGTLPSEQPKQPKRLSSSPRDMSRTRTCKLKRRCRKAHVLQGQQERTYTTKFWKSVEGCPSGSETTSGKRLRLLIEYAKIRIRHSGNTRERYQFAKRKRLIEALTTGQCFACLTHQPLNWHHIIQIQHGGSNHLRNRVEVCEECHEKIHPWMQQTDSALPDDAYRPLFARIPKPLKTGFDSTPRLVKRHDCAR